MYKLHYCFMREACQFACFEQNTSAELYPLHCVLCSTTGEREYDGKDWLGLRSWSFATHVISLQARSQADRQQLCTLEHPLWQGTVTFHGDLLHRHRRFPSVRLPCTGMLREPLSLQGSTSMTMAVQSFASSWGNEGSWLVHLIECLIIFQQGYKPPLTSVSFSGLNPMDMLISPP